VNDDPLVGLGDYLDRDVEVLHWLNVATCDEALQFAERIQKRETITWVEALEAAQLALNADFCGHDGKTSIVIYLPNLSAPEKRELLKVLEPMLSKLWKYSRQLYVVSVSSSDSDGFGMEFLGL
jgi:hypothetical protein